VIWLERRDLGGEREPTRSPDSCVPVATAPATEMWAGCQVRERPTPLLQPGGEVAVAHAARHADDPSIGVELGRPSARHLGQRDEDAVGVGDVVERGRLPSTLIRRSRAISSLNASCEVGATCSRAS
jgi:hypothetical protein